MAPVKIIFFKKISGRFPALDFISEQSDYSKDQIHKQMMYLKKDGHELGRPHCAYLRDKIYELRVDSDNLKLRLLYFFYAQTAVVLSHGIVKKTGKVPKKEIEKAIKHRELFEQNPGEHYLPDRKQKK